MKRIFAAVAMAAAALATLGLADPAAVSAGASSQAAAGHVVRSYARGHAGYNMTGGGWRFRRIETTLTVPASTTRATRAQIALANLDWGLSYVYIDVNSGGGPGSISYGIFGDTAKTLAVAPSAGDQVTISIYYDRAAAQNRFTAIDLSTGARATAVESLRTAVVDAWVFGFGPRWSLASSTSRLWAFKDTSLTSYNGTHGGILGPWNTYRIIGTRGGTSTGKVVLWPAYPSNGGHNFGIWWRAAS
jgi:hypothetical protein